MSYEEECHTLSPHTATEKSDTEDIHESSSSDEFGMDFYPLLSPPNVEMEEEEKENSSSRWPLAPLFLKLMCSIRDEESGGEPQVTTMDGLPLCLSELYCNYHQLTSSAGSILIMKRPGDEMAKIVCAVFCTESWFLRQLGS